MATQVKLDLLPDCDRVGLCIYISVVPQRIALLVYCQYVSGAHYRFSRAREREREVRFQDELRGWWLGG